MSTMNNQHMELLVTDGWRDLLRDLIVPFAFGDLAPCDLGSKVIEIGPGPGLTTDLFASEVASLIALELDPALASSLAQRFEGSATVAVVEGDATDMAFDDNSFTGAASFTMLHHVPEFEMQDRLFAEVQRVLRPGGLFVASDSVASDELEAFHVDDICNPIDPTRVEARLTRAGFVDVSVRWNDFGWAAHARA